MSSRPPTPDRQRRRPRRQRLPLPIRLHASRLARRPQNAADRIAGARLSRDANVNMILIDLAQRESMNVSADFARLLHREGAPVFPFRPDWHRFAAFIVLKAPDIPSILFESGYLTNPVDAAYISSLEGRRQISTACSAAIGEAICAADAGDRGGGWHSGRLLRLGMAPHCVLYNRFSREGGLVLVS